MSIINDALKKVQTNLVKKEQKEPPTNKVDIYAKLHKPREPQPPQDPSTTVNTNPILEKPESSPVTLPILIGAFTLIIGFLLAVLIFVSNPALMKSKTVSSAPAASTVEPTVTPPKVYGKDEFVLSGIMMMGDKRVALINNDIYETGETIQGRKIINITFDKVELQDGQKIIELSVRKSK